jgi:hypothetical protein
MEEEGMTNAQILAAVEEILNGGNPLYLNPGNNQWTQEIGSTRIMLASAYLNSIDHGYKVQVISNKMMMFKLIIEEINSTASLEESPGITLDDYFFDGERNFARRLQKFLLKCQCSSYNNFGNCGDVPAVVLAPPDWSSKESIEIDSCIANAVQYLWDNGVITSGCCCGHNVKNPSVIINNSSIEHVRELLGQIDYRQWEIIQQPLSKNDHEN